MSDWQYGDILASVNTDSRIMFVGREHPYDDRPFGQGGFWGFKAIYLSPIENAGHMCPGGGHPDNRFNSWRKEDE